MTISKMDAWAKISTWSYKMDNSKGLDGRDNYGGGDFEQADWVVVPVGRNRDSGILDESNFEAALDMLSGESKNVAVCRFGHWGCGWFELLLVNPKSKTKLKIAFDIKESLDNYPVLDESDFSDRENEYQSEYAKGAQDDLAEALSKHFSVKNGKALKDLAYELNIACQSYYGNDSCIDVYTNRTPGAQDLDRLKTCLKEIEYNYKDNKAYQKLALALQVKAA